jgi:type I restriction enzyme S subunit
VFRNYPFVPIVRLIVLTPNEDIIIPEFLMRVLKTLDILRTGSSIPQLTVPMFKTYSIPVPDLEKQKEIVETLDIVDNHIQSLLSTYEEELKNLEELKKSILQKAFSGELTN